MLEISAITAISYDKNDFLFYFLLIILIKCLTKYDTSHFKI